MTATVTLERQLADFAATVSLDTLPSDVVAAVKRLVLDSVGVALAGASAPGVGPAVEAARHWGGDGSTVYSVGFQVAAPFAALANGVMSTARDFDDTLDDAMLHTMPSVLPAVLALAERRASSGAEVVAAVAAGAEVLCRMGRARRRGQHFLPTGTLAAMAAAAACARLLRLDADGVLDACGVAYSQVAGNVQPLHEGKLVKRYHAGFAARNGVMSADLASRGLTGAHAFLEGDNGYYRLYEGGEYTRDVITEDLGTRWHLLELSLKPYPSARDNHGLVEAALDVATNEDLSPADIVGVDAFLPPNPYGVSGRPFGSLGGDPVVEAIISAAYCTASALLRGRQVLEDFTPEGVADPAVRKLAGRVRVHIHQEVSDPVTFVPQRLVVRLGDGRVVTRDIAALLGHPDRPLDDGAISAKLRACLDFAGAAPSSAETIAATVARLEELSDAGHLARLLGGV